MSEPDKRIHVVVTGIVQGVFFRASTVEEARRLGEIKGFVRNLPDGSVEIVAEGPEEKLKKLLAWAHHGPARAKVISVKASWGVSQKDLGEFNVSN